SSVACPLSFTHAAPHADRPSFPTRRSSDLSPMQGTIVKVAVEDGELIAEGDLVVVLEAMKMEQPLVAHRAGRIHGLAAAVGETVSAGTVICQIDAVADAKA